MKYRANPVNKKEVFMKRKKRNYCFWMRALAMLCAVMIFLPFFVATEAHAATKLPGGNSGKITVIDYGNAGMDADAVLVESNGKYILMDTGYTDSKNLSNSSVIRTLKNMGIRKLDLYLSHWHNDHYYMMTTIMKDPYFTVGTVYLPYSQRLLDLSASKNKDCKWYKDLTKNIKRSGKSWGPHSYTEVMDTLNKKRSIHVVTLRQGSSFKVGDADFKVLWQRSSFSKPSKRTRHLNQVINNTSLVTRVTIGGVRYLTAGDIHKSVERDIMRAGVDLKADIFKTSHHSNKDTSNCPEFFKAIGASWAFGTGKASTTCQNGAAKAKTNYINLKDNGQITFTINNGEISVSAKKNLKTVKRTYKDASGKKHTKTFVFDNKNKYFFKKAMFPKGSSGY